MHNFGPEAMDLALRPLIYKIFKNLVFCGTRLWNTRNKGIGPVLLFSTDS